MAAGLTIKTDGIEAFTEAFNDVLDEHFDHVDYEQTLFTDGELNRTELSLSVAEQLNMCFPWGQRFPEPVFEGVFDVHFVRVLNGGHIKWTFVLEGGELIDAIYFNVKTPEAFLAASKLKLCYRLSVNEFRDNRTLQLMIDFAEVV